MQRIFVLIFAVTAVVRTQCHTHVQSQLRQLESEFHAGEMASELVELSSFKSHKATSAGTASLLRTDATTASSIAPQLCGVTVSETASNEALCRRALVCLESETQNAHAATAPGRDFVLSMLGEDTTGNDTPRDSDLAACAFARGQGAETIVVSLRHTLEELSKEGELGDAGKANIAKKVLEAGNQLLVSRREYDTRNRVGRNIHTFALGLFVESLITASKSGVHQAEASKYKPVGYSTVCGVMCSELNHNCKCERVQLCMRADQAFDNNDLRACTHEVVTRVDYGGRFDNKVTPIREFTSLLDFISTEASESAVDSLLKVVEEQAIGGAGFQFDITQAATQRLGVTGH